MVIDTGSDINWLPCEPCSECYQQTHPIFNPDDSSTYKRVSCDSPACSALDVSDGSINTCQYQVSYGDGSFTIGELATETVSFGNSSFFHVAIGCDHDNEGLFIDSAGLIGLGGGSLSLPSQIKATSFSYRLVNRNSDSSSTLEFNSARPSDAVLAPLLCNSRRSTFFFVCLEGINVSCERLPILANIFQVDDSGHGGIIVDSGMAVTRLHCSVYNSLRDTFVKYAQNLPSTDGFVLFDTCFDLLSMKTASVPTVAFHFSGGKVVVAPEEYTGSDILGGEVLKGPSFAPRDGSLVIIGNLHQQGTRVSYDFNA
ncbi:hypothetical protein RND71_006213 [Anisodus tanguticus]|uniref:Peptidase A1 domain-containing protein n=1 Tax=Anisodus tanguticus TaxID=243964 RepID=A0AAE1VT09_9SOLA|nr:hypothetical protein RND71_006213 [Anisodus tanguticus]